MRIDLTLILIRIDWLQLFKFLPHWEIGWYKSIMLNILRQVWSREDSSATIMDSRHARELNHRNWVKLRDLNDAIFRKADLVTVWH